MLPVKEIDTYAQRRCCLYLTDQLPEGKEEFPKDFGVSSGLSAFCLYPRSEVEITPSPYAWSLFPAHLADARGLLVPSL